MGLSRRFLNLIVGSDEPTIRSLRCIDLERLQLFYPPPPPATPLSYPTASSMETFGLPEPTPIFRASDSDVPRRWRVACHPLAQRRVLCTDQCRRNFLYDAGTHEVAAIPEFYRPRLNSLSIFVPTGEDDNGREEGSEGEEDRQEGSEDKDQRGSSGHLFLMEKFLRPVTGDLEVLFYGNGRRTSHCKLLPPPPYINVPSKIGSYTVVGNGSHVCISVDGRGTYFLDTATYTWNRAGDWTLPFHGKAEYVPELKLWFGLSAEGQHLIAADLSTAFSQPQPVYSWKMFQPPAEWIEHRDAQLVNLGSGKFCIARFFKVDRDFEVGDCSLDFIVLTGLEVVKRGLNDGGNGNGNGRNGKVKLEMIPHKSMRHTTSPAYGNSVDLVF